MAIGSDPITARSNTYPTRVNSSDLIRALEALFLAWIGAFASLTFLGSLILAAFQVLTLTDLAHIYGAITLVTLALAALLYLARRNR